MAIYRNIQMSFWTDSKIVDEFTPEDRYFYLYLFTNPHTNLAGCYELSIKQASVETGYDIAVINTLLRRFDEIHNVIKYSPLTKEVLLLNWHKYNWTASEKFRKPLLDEIRKIKTDAFREYLLNVFNNDTVSIPYTYPMDTTVAVTDTVTDTVTDAVDMIDLLNAEQIHELYRTYERAGELIEEVQAEVNKKHLQIKVSAYSYIVGYAKNKGWQTCTGRRGND